MKTTGSILDKIIASKKRSLANAKQLRTQAQLERDAKNLSIAEVANFYDVLKAAEPRLKIIAEIKKSSPSTGEIRRNFSLKAVNECYQEALPVAAISVITETEHFQGSEDALTYVTKHNSMRKPLLRKDFLFDQYQILETKLLGAQAYLLIATLFDFNELQDLISYGQSLNLEPLVEVHTAQELELVLQTTVRCIGVNSRNLQTFTIDNSVHELLRGLNDTYVRIAESGIDNLDYLHYLHRFSDAALIGSYFMKSEDIAAAISSLTTPRDVERSSI